MNWLRPSHGGVTGHSLPAQPAIVAVHLHRRGDLAAAEHCLSRLANKVYVMSERRTKKAQPHAEALHHLSEGDVVLMAPEGTHSWAGQVHRLDVEVARLALDAGALVVPAQVVGGQLHLGTSVDMSRHAATPHSHAVLRAAADDVALALCKLTGLPYQDYPAVRADQRPHPIIWLFQMRKLRRDRRRHRRDAEERSREESARDAEDLAREEENARLAAQLQARQASLADRLAERDIHPGR